MPDGVWHNADGTTSPIVKATADGAAPEAEGPSQEFLQALVAAEQDRLRAEGWQACIDRLRSESHTRSPAVDGVVLSGEDLWWIERQNPYRSPAISPGRRGE